MTTTWLPRLLEAVPWSRLVSILSGVALLVVGLVLLTWMLVEAVERYEAQTRQKRRGER